MKRALLLALGVAVPLAMLLYPAFRRAVLARLQLVLVLYGLLLVGVGVYALGGGTRSAGETAAGVVGLTLLAAAVVSIAFDLVKGGGGR